MRQSITKTNDKKKQKVEHLGILPALVGQLLSRQWVGNLTGMYVNVKAYLSFSAPFNLFLLPFTVCHKFLYAEQEVQCVLICVITMLKERHLLKLG